MHSWFQESFKGKKLLRQVVRARIKKKQKQKQTTVQQGSLFKWPKISIPCQPSISELQILYKLEIYEVGEKNLSHEIRKSVSSSNI